MIIDEVEKREEILRRALRRLYNEVNAVRNAPSPVLQANTSLDLGFAMAEAGQALSQVEGISL